MTDLVITVTRTRCGKTQARLVGRVDGYEVDVTVTGWRRTSVLAEAEATFAAVTTNPAHLLPKGLP